MLRRNRAFACLVILFPSFLGISLWGQGKPTGAASAIPAPASKMPAPKEDKAITETDCSTTRLGGEIPVTAIGEPVSSIILNAPVWNAATDSVPAYCSVEGSMAPIDPMATPIIFRVALPASWSHRASQLGGGGNDGIVPNLTQNPGPATYGPSLLARGFVTYGSDSGHQMPAAGGGGIGGPGALGTNDWALNDEAMTNFGYMQLKKTHDAAMVLIQRMYGERPRFNYFFGTSQGGREALTVAQRYPSDYDGIAANVPVVNFSSLTLAPEWIRIQEKPLANWVTPAKVNAIRGEVMRQCDKLDGLVDGIVNNYMACRTIFDVKQGAANRNPWTAKRCPNNMDPNPSDTSADACLTDGQISTLEMVYSPYFFAVPLANGVKSFGMWFPNTDPSGNGLIATMRYHGQEGAPEDAPMHSHLGIMGVTGFLMKNPKADPLDYKEGGTFEKRREQISKVLDSTDPDLSPFYQRGGKLMVVIGTNDTLASPGAQVAYFQSVIDKLGQPKVDAFARFFVLPQTGHGLTGNSYNEDGDGKQVVSAPIPNSYDRVGLLINWVENNVAPAKSLVAATADRSLPMCSYPTYPKYVSGPATAASSYICAAP